MMPTDVRRYLDRGQGMYKLEPVVADSGEVIIRAASADQLHPAIVDEWATT